MNRKSKIQRKTAETSITIELDVDGTGQYQVETGIQFLNHMLESFTRHSLFDMKVEAQGDTEIDDHHTVEDIGIVLGEALHQALGDKKGIRRMAHALIPMDESLAMIAVDLSGRSYTVLDLNFHQDKVGDLSTENVGHFLESLAQSGKINLHARVEGENDHHQVEAIFKALARALHDATRVVHDRVPSTKGVI
ncbi:MULTISPECIES: imidazoleglycerol-phosphate dehydratase HisB [Methanobacterium]|uniref:Imidazoleglycerol-phosphate dehydratase n=1 Tax=Methanobacterium formicicum TaxID=2162 RepID=A0A089ZFQ9_METFO|nr:MULTISPECIES: imidazoleglycerol-phosphate dehydratase HisB [Methanobacterium]AIS30883.1 imidazoleglycerol-phosphate dehydratase HisB [Methanobacterium formicicum]KUK74309.1 MAG: Imidazoleglycerol-phosphate dehydratase [Methanobacterium sp. 42_16]MBF4474938.1 imidazoleglycerol-phosphate dehydratase HisB [Methanobacterium formicicum]MDD4810539.1 imidazoleglycerol-phosphate dehydratase HisB [Methanobacterium formicicum]MDG3547008.1 imidazoleglycerol-phosphate dehydratase HisB [Methanobacterium